MTYQETDSTEKQWILLGESFIETIKQFFNSGTGAFKLNYIALDTKKGITKIAILEPNLKTGTKVQVYTKKVAILIVIDF